MCVRLSCDESCEWKVTRVQISNKACETPFAILEIYRKPLHPCITRHHTHHYQYYTALLVHTISAFKKICDNSCSLIELQLEHLLIFVVQVKLLLSISGLFRYSLKIDNSILRTTIVDRKDKQNHMIDTTNTDNWLLNENAQDRHLKVPKWGPCV